MPSVPVHPALVHIPLGLAFVIPVIAAVFAWALWTGRVSSRGWIAVVALQAVLLGAGALAANTGEREEERVEAVVPSSAMNRHEAAAEQFLWATAVTLVLAGSVMVSRRAAARALALASVAGTVLVAAAAVQVGHAGGELVYVHNAGAAYGSGSVARSQAAERSPVPVAEKRRHHDDAD